MRVTSILLLSLLGVVSASDDRGLAAMKGIFGGSNSDSEVVTIERVFSEEDLAGRKDDGVIDADCGFCSPDDLDNIDCTTWDITLSYQNVRDRSLFCGCAARITGEEQCAGFSEDAPQLIEDFAVKKCGVHLLCTMGLFDDEPRSHKCEENCWFPIGKWGIGCFAEGDTKCFFAIDCTALIQTR